MGILNIVFDEMNSVVDEVVNQTIGMKPGKKKKSAPRKQQSSGRRIVVNVYKEIHDHRHFHDYKNFNKK